MKDPPQKSHNAPFPFSKANASRLRPRVARGLHEQRGGRNKPRKPTRVPGRDGRGGWGGAGGGGDAAVGAPPSSRRGSKSLAKLSVAATEAGDGEGGGGDAVPRTGRSRIVHLRGFLAAPRPDARRRHLRPERPEPPWGCGGGGRVGSRFDLFLLFALFQEGRGPEFLLLLGG